ncbi:MAG: hypothetical protein ACKOZY_04540 [Flavobacteriales bacterium]
MFAILCLVAGVLWFVLKNKSAESSLSGDVFTEFAIEDTSSIQKIVITDQAGKVAQLQRVQGQRLWRLNDTYWAREDAMNLILKTIRRIGIRGKVAESARENMLKLLATGSKKVEIYTQDPNTPAKIYYVGSATPDHTGTIMLLEIPGQGRGQDPYVTHMEGFTGFLSTRFFADEMEWRYTGIFDYPKLDFTEVSMQIADAPSASYTISYAGGNQITMKDGLGQLVNNMDTAAVKNLLLAYRKVHAETFITQLTPAQTDSVRSLPPHYTIQVRGADGAINRVDFYLKRANKVVLREDGQPEQFDGSYLYAKLSDGTLGLAQTYNIEPLLRPVQAYH